MMNCEKLRSDFYLLREAPDSQEAQEMRRHLEHCPDCARYVREMEQALDWLTPRRTPQTPAAFARKMRDFSAKPAALPGKTGGTLARLLRPGRMAAAVALLVGCAALLALWLLPSRLTAGQSLTPAEAAPYFARALAAQPRTMQIEMLIRTPRYENFAAIDADSAFVTHRLTTLADGRKLLWRMEKEGGRTVVCDGERQWMWSPDFAVCVTGPRESNFVEELSLLLRPDEILTAEQEAAERGEGIGYELQETDEETRLTVNAPRQYVVRNGMGLDRTLGNAENRRTYVFDRRTGRLKSFSIVLRRGDTEVEVARSVAIRYDLPVDRAALLALPVLPPMSDGTARQWVDAEVAGNEGIARRRSARTAARRIVEALSDGRLAPVEAALTFYPDTALLLRTYGGMQVHEVGKAYRSGNYAGWYVPVRCTLPDGRQGVLTLALRNDNESGRWYVDGGL